MKNSEIFKAALINFVQFKLYYSQESRQVQPKLIQTTVVVWGFIMYQTLSIICGAYKKELSFLRQSTTNSLFSTSPFSDIC